jgi:hypothetical protein
VSEKHSPVKGQITDPLRKLCPSLLVVHP